MVASVLPEISRSTSAFTVTVAPISPVPEIIGVVSFVAGRTSIVGAAGDSLSTVIEPVAEPLVFPAESS